MEKEIEMKNHLKTYLDVWLDFFLVYIDVDYNIAIGSSSNREAMSRSFRGPYF